MVWSLILTHGTGVLASGLVVLERDTMLVTEARISAGFWCQLPP